MREDTAYASFRVEMVLSRSQAVRLVNSLQSAHSGIVGLTSCSKAEFIDSEFTRVVVRVKSASVAGFGARLMVGVDQFRAGWPSGAHSVHVHELGVISCCVMIVKRVVRVVDECLQHHIVMAMLTKH